LRADTSASNLLCVLFTRFIALVSSCFAAVARVLAVLSSAFASLSSRRRLSIVSKWSFIIYF
jgi:hypothetical protein